jgi:LytR cell envelope-related transcriptional attenuator
MSLARVRSLIILGALVVVAVVVVTWTLLSDDQGHPGNAAASCGPSQTPAATKIPAEKAVTINVYNSTDRDGLAQATAKELQARGFKIGQIAADPLQRVVTSSAELRYGPTQVGAAQLLRAYVPGATSAFDLNRTTGAAANTVDVVLGSKYQQLNTPAQVKEAIVALGDPSAPPGTC